MIFIFNIGFLNVSWVDLVDIFLVSLFLYQIYKLMKGSVAVNIFLGVLALYLGYLIVRAAQMELLALILGQFMGVGVLAAIILFQPEIRKFLLLVGRTTDLNKDSIFTNVLRWKRKEQERAYNITPVVEAARALSGTNTGALIVFSRDSQLKFFAESGDIIDAEVSKRLLLSIFDKHSPLHDGAVIIHKGRIKAARCVLPVSENDELPAQYGLRHRAAIGMSEETNTLVFVISEETGQMSLAIDGRIDHNLTPLEIRQRINDYLFGKESRQREQVEESAAGQEQKSREVSEAGAAV
ncbi:MAG: diadenylate cyclase CdaA [Cyclobacteriaceae bacterium]|nr:diadenylate cyclase CdaA [Cyclobacteriaceae bacterium]